MELLLLKLKVNVNSDLYSTISISFVEMLLFLIKSVSVTVM